MTSKYFIFILGLVLLSVVSATSITQLSDFTATTPQVVQNAPSEEDTWSEKQICKFTKGCLTEDYCYPFGYVMDSQYCGNTETKHGFKIITFVNQSESQENCTYDFQCKSNFCFNKKCVNSIESLIVNLNSKITNLELKIKEEDKKEIRENISEEKEITEEQLPIIENKEKERSFFERIFGWKK